MESVTERSLSLDQAKEEIGRLKVLVEASKLINSSIEPRALYDSILSVARKQLLVERGTLYFVDSKKEEIWASISVEDNISEIRLPLGHGVAGTVAATGETIILHDVQRDPRFDPTTDKRSGFHTRSMLCVPIRNRSGRIVGVLQLLNKMLGSFGPKDVEFLESISDHMAIAMDNATMHLDLLQKNRMEQELLLGREIQSRLLPSPPSDIPCTELAATSLSCYEVGGDYYDFIPLPTGELGLAIGDVSGKGVAAAIIMSSVQAALHVAAPLEDDLVRLVEHLNGILFQMTKGRKYVTFFFGRYEPKTGRLRYVNAGHNPPLLLHEGEVRPLLATGKPVGLIPDLEYRQETVDVPPGATLLLYTDGLTEAQNPEGEEFEAERLATFLVENASLPVVSVVTRLIETITRFENGQPQVDDKTLVVLRRSMAGGAVIPSESLESV